MNSGWSRFASFCLYIIMTSQMSQCSSAKDQARALEIIAERTAK